jgi:hypothetical protein
VPFAFGERQAQALQHASALRLRHGMPITLAARATRSVTGLRAGQVHLLLVVHRAAGGLGRAADVDDQLR